MWATPAGLPAGVAVVRPAWAAACKGQTTISFSTSAPTGASVGGLTYTPTASATSGLPVALTPLGSAQRRSVPVIREGRRGLRRLNPQSSEPQAGGGTALPDTMIVAALVFAIMCSPPTRLLSERVRSMEVPRWPR